MAPAETGEVIEDCFGEIALLFVLEHGHRAVALRELLAVRAADEGQVRKDRHFGAKRVVDVDLARRVVDVVGAADDVAHLHVPVVDDDCEVVGGDAVAHDDEVVELAVGDRNRAVDGVVPSDGAFIRVAEAHDGLDAFGNGLALGVFRTPAAVVAGLEAEALLLFAHGVELFGRGVAVVRVAGGEQLIDDFLVAGETVHLIDGTFVVVEVEPLHAVENDLNGFLRRTDLVGVFNAQQELAAEVAGDGPAVDGGARRAEVHHARRTRGDAGANFFHDSKKRKLHPFAAGAGAAVSSGA